MISRRQFLGLFQMLGLSVLVPGINASCSREKEIKGAVGGQNAALGHRLRTMDFGKISETFKTDLVIVGGGVAGLSAARHLQKHSANYYLLEMNEHSGGNALGSENSFSKYPLGAHYLPVPGNSDPELISFLHEANVITGIESGLPIFNEYYLCHDPKERLYINNFWQEGIVPHEGVPKKDREEIQRFLELMDAYKVKTGNDGRTAFSIPLTLSSKDPDIIKLDAFTAEQFLRTHRFRSPYLYWYVNYCCADDFGSSIAQTSAWAMIHYFASRKAKAQNASSDAVLTWPEGNYWLIKQMEAQVKNSVISNALVYRIDTNASGVVCTYYDASHNTSKQIFAKAAILATPQFINQRILPNVARQLDYSQFQYAPWMVANIVTNHPLNERRGEPICWDNVIYGSNALGYVNASHQEISVQNENKVITYYKPLLSDNVQTARQDAHRLSYKDWEESIFQDLKKPHPKLNNQVKEINVWLWGHGMVRPSVNFIWNENRIYADKSIDNKIFFANSDLSGISIFEEAFFQGHKAARQALSS